MYSGTVRVIRGTTLASKLQHVARFCTTPVSTEDRRTDRLHTHRLTTNPLTNPLTRWLAYRLTVPLGRLELLHALVIKHGFSPEHGFGVAAVLPFVLPLCSSASDRLLCGHVCHGYFLPCGYTCYGYYYEYYIYC